MSLEVRAKSHNSTIHGIKIHISQKNNPQSTELKSTIHGKITKCFDCQYKIITFASGRL